MKSSAAPYIVIIILLLGVVFVLLEDPSIISNALSSNLAHFITKIPGVTTIPSQNQENYSQLQQYALTLINQDRAKYGLQSVTLSGEPSGLQHANSMLQYDYFSHWDIYGMKPYMRYTALGGTGAVSENVAYQSASACSLFGCTGTIDPQQSIQAMEYSMMYNDSTCCNNGHRDNILNPNHNQVSIGIAYNGSAIYFTEDFIDNYINWGNSPGYAQDTVYLNGTLQSGYTISQIEVSYDPTVQGMSRSQLDNTSDYGYGTAIAGVVQSPLYYYPNIQTIDASEYNVNGNQFTVSFNMQQLISQYGAGEYTVMVYLDNSTGGSFIGSTYTLFLDSNGNAQVPSNI